MKRAALAVVATFACIAPERPVETFASARVVSDFDTYDLHRVGLLPFGGAGAGAELDRESAREVQSAFLAEAAGSLPFELVPLVDADMMEVPRSDPFRRGRYRAATIVEIARRFSLDGILVGTITDRAPFAPQRLGLAVELVAAETGVVVWSSEVHLDTSQERVRRSLRVWFEEHGGGGSEGQWSVVLLSPTRLAHFAAWQLVALYRP